MSARRGLVRWIVLLQAIGLLGAPPRATAQTAALPDLQLVQSPGFHASAYPDWDGTLLRSATLSEHQRTEGGVIAWLSVESAGRVWLSVDYYAATGSPQRLVEALPLPQSQHTQLTFPLPAADAGLLRLVVWTRAPGSTALAALDTPPDPQQRIAGLADERWFPRAAPAAVLPLADDRQRYERPPAGILRSRAPYIWSRLGADGMASAKNCGVQFSGLTRVGADEWGAYGQWQLGTGSTFQVQFELPSRRRVSHAVLRLDGQLDAPFAGAKPPGFELDLNNMRVKDVQPVGAPGALEQLEFDLSQSVQSGSNTLTLRSTGFGSNWLLQNVELWVE